MYVCMYSVYKVDYRVAAAPKKHDKPYMAKKALQSETQVGKNKV